jgi:eukaryotic-like serine/threonine-protein kinase
MVDGAARAPQRVIGRYALYGEIAAGGMATVHVGRLVGPVGFSRTVAIKRLHPQFAKDPEFVSMFLDEARVAARIQHPNVVATLDVVALEGELFLVMEYVEGETLARVLRTLKQQKRRMPPKIAAAIVVNLLNGLHAAHEAKSERGEPLGIVHRDVSPQNVLIGVDGVARVLDFGVAKATGRVQSTRDGQVKGKLGYMPPEQISGEKVDRRLDVYASAVVLWEALTSQRLFEGDNDAVVLNLVLAGGAKAPSTIVPGLPAGVDEIVAKGLARNPKDRFETAHDLAIAIEDTIGIESPRKVGEFVQACAAEAIAKRAARVKDVESISSAGSLDEMMSAASFTDSASPGLSPHDNSSVTRMSSVSISTVIEPRRSRGRLFALTAIIAILGAAALGFVFLRKNRESASATQSGAPGSVSAPSSAASAAALAGAAPQASSGPRADTPPATASAAHSALPPLAHPPIPWNAGAAKKPDCTNPKVFVNGIWKFRPECMN